MMIRTIKSVGKTIRAKDSTQRRKDLGMTLSKIRLCE